MKKRKHYPELERQEWEIRESKNHSICPNCGSKGPHFCPPMFGEAGFYLCEPIKEDGVK